MIYLGDQAVGIATSLPEFADIAKIECGSYTPSVDTIPNQVSISHSLGEMPDFFCYYCNGIEGLDNYQYTYLVNGFIYPIHYSLPTITQDSISQNLYTKINASGLAFNTNLVNINTYASNASFTFMSKVNTDRLKANVTYYYVIGKFKEVTPNA